MFADIVHSTHIFLLEFHQEVSLGIVQSSLIHKQTSHHLENNGAKITRNPVICSAKLHVFIKRRLNEADDRLFL